MKSKKNKASMLDKMYDNNLLENLNFVSKEQYKLLRANLQFTLPEYTKCAVIGVTSSVKGEGKSTVAINLSYVLAEAGKKVLLIDGDLRLPTIARKLGLETSPGFTDLLLDNSLWNPEKFKSDKNDNWYILPSGKIPPNPSELLGSKKTEKLIEMLSEEFDYILFDFPPVTVVSDVLTLSNILTGVVLIVRENYVARRDFDMCKRQLDLSGIKVFGCVVNGELDGGGYYKKYGKYGKKYYGKYGRYGRYSDYYVSQNDGAESNKK